MNNKSGILSHPNKYIEDHVSNVLNLSLRFFDNIQNQSQKEKILKDILSIIVFAHDIGKTTRFFQDYITGRLDKKSETRHSLLGGVVGFYLADIYLNSIDVDDPFLRAISFILPKRHHSNLKDFLDELILNDEELKLLELQINSIDNKSFKTFIENIDFGFKQIQSFSLNDIILKDISDKLSKVKRKIRKLKDEKSIRYFIDTILLFSILLDADKSDAGIKEEDKSGLFNEKYIEPTVVDKYITNKLANDKDNINKIRTEAFNEISDFGIDLNKKIYAITLPTGIGKTLLSFKLALKIADKVKQELNKDLKIIYSLPFLSVIEQNYSVFEEVLNTNDNSVLLKYHHLTGFSYKNEDEEYDYDTSRILIEGFNSKIIVTTFMQFFYSILSNKNKMLRKFHKFANSVIILDEVQSIPHEYWLLIRELFIEMTKRFNCYIILSTATQPLIFEENDYVNVVNYENYFQKFNRYKLNIDLTSKTVEEFYGSLNIEDNKSYLFVMNTVPSAKKLYMLLKEKYPDDIEFLSTHVIPKDRFQRINDIRNKKKRIVVSTQLIEAGVDVDFDVVYRDFAPLDSIIQSAGRCNRHGIKNEGIVNVIRLKDDNNKFYSSRIYDTYLLNKTQEVLKQKYYEEKDINTLITDYFNLVKDGASDYISQRLLEMIYKLKFYGEKEKEEVNSIQDFVLIKEDFYKQDVFIEKDDQAKEIWETYKNEVVNNKKVDMFQRRKKFDEIKARFYEYVISVPIKGDSIKEDSGFYYISEKFLKHYYDLGTGFITDDGGYLEY